MVMVIPSWVVQMAGKETAELQHSYKFMEKEGTAEVSQTSMFTGDSYISRRILHLDEIVMKQ